MTAKVTIVGLIRGGTWARDIRRTRDLDIAAIVEIDPDRLKAIGDEVGVPESQRFLDFDEAMKVDADVVIIATPTPTHFPLSVAALEAGHHVICEKPLVMSLAEAHDFRNAVKQYGCRFMVGEQYRFSDGVENMRRAIQDGLIGRLAYIDHEFRRATPVRPDPIVESHRALREMSVHHFDMWWYMTGERPVEVRADAFRPEWNPGTRQFGHSIRATLEGGTTVHYLTSRALHRPQTTWPGNITIVGEEGALSWDGNTSHVTLHRSLPTHDVRQHNVATGEVAYVRRGVISPVSIPADESASIVMLRELLSSIGEERRCLCDIDDNWPSFATAMAAIESAETGKPARVELL